MTERERFEAWARKGGTSELQLTHNVPKNGYLDSHADTSWTAWQAAVASRDEEIAKLRKVVEAADALRDELGCMCPFDDDECTGDCAVARYDAARAKVKEKP